MVTTKLREVWKNEDTKIFECPASVVTPRTWQILRLVNECTGGEHCDLLHFPFPGGLLDQPTWFREAVQIVRAERAKKRQADFDEMKNK